MQGAGWIKFMLYQAFVVVRRYKIQSAYIIKF